MIDSTTVRGHSQAAGAKGGLTRRALVEVAAALRARSTPVRTVRDVLSAVCQLADGLVCDPTQHIGQLGPQVDVVQLDGDNEAVDSGRTLAATVGLGEQP